MRTQTLKLPRADRQSGRRGLVDADPGDRPGRAAGRAVQLHRRAGHRQPPHRAFDGLARRRGRALLGIPVAGLA